MLPLDIDDAWPSRDISDMTPKPASTPTLAGMSARALGAYYTPTPAAELLARWVVRQEGDRVLEPSMGDGAFLQAIDSVARNEPSNAEVWGVEMAADTYESTVRSGLIDPSRALRSDFMEVTPFAVNGVLGNPPYVRIRHLPADQAERAIAVANQVLGEPMDPSGSLWMPFVLHATQFLVKGGRLGFVLPYDMTYVRYARPLWRFLGEHFANLRVFRVRERVFPEILQDVVLFLADGFGGRTSHVQFEAYRTSEQLESGRPSVATRLPIEQIVQGGRVFLEALISDEARQLLIDRIVPATFPAKDLVTFNIGYVCGDKAFFHPDPQTVAAFGLPESSLRVALTSARQLRGAGLFTAHVPKNKVSTLFLPPTNETDLEQGEIAYIGHGEHLRVHERYKCRIRRPWYVTPGVKRPDVLLPVFTERPVMLINDGDLVASNSLLCGYLLGGDPTLLTAGWFSSLTLLQLELQVHALGGGVMVMVPREAASIRLPRVRSVDGSRLSDIHTLLLNEKVDQAFESGDEPVLRDELGLTTIEIGLIQEATAELASWRTSSRSTSS